VALGVKLPLSARGAHVALHAWCSVRPSTSLAVTLNATEPAESTGFGVPLGPAVMVTVLGAEFTVCTDASVALKPNPSSTVTARLQACGSPVELVGAVHVGFGAVALGAKLPLSSRPAQVALQAYCSARPSTSLAVTLTATEPAESTGFGVPLGPAVIVTVLGAGFTVCADAFVAPKPNPSSTVTVTVQAWAAPVRFAGAVHVGFGAVALGVKPPLSARVAHVVLHAKCSVRPSMSLAVTLNATEPAESTGFGVPLGPAVIVTVLGAGLTVCA
jgi:hypothetical protein